MALLQEKQRRKEVEERRERTTQSLLLMVRPLLTLSHNNVDQRLLLFRGPLYFLQTSPCEAKGGGSFVFSKAEDKHSGSKADWSHRLRSKGILHLPSYPTIFSSLRIAQKFIVDAFRILFSCRSCLVRSRVAETCFSLCLLLFLLSLCRCLSLH